MIRNQWYVVLETAEVGTHPIGVTRLGEKLVFWRDPAGSDHPTASSQRFEDRRNSHPGRFADY